MTTYQPQCEDSSPPRSPPIMTTPKAQSGTGRERKGHKETQALARDKPRSPPSFRMLYPPAAALRTKGMQRHMPAWAWLGRLQAVNCTGHRVLCQQARGARAGSKMTHFRHEGRGMAHGKKGQVVRATQSNAHTPPQRQQRPGSTAGTVHALLRTPKDSWRASVHPCIKPCRAQGHRTGEPEGMEAKLHRRGKRNAHV